MRTIGLLGGMSWHSTALYYSRINRRCNERMGGLHSASMLLRSLDFAAVERLQSAGDWEGAGALLNSEALALERGGAELLVLATNTMHKVADRMMQGVGIPMLHVGDATAQAIRAAGLERPALIATAYTMEQRFYTDRLRAAGLSPVLPSQTDRCLIHGIIYDELCQGRVREESRAAYEGIAAQLEREGGADCLILGCTEVGMLLDETNVGVPVFDTTLIHCDRALDLALSPVEAL